MPIQQSKIINYADLTPEKARAGCFVVGMPNDDYHAYEGLSSTGVKNILRSPAHYAADSFERTRAMEVGSAIHAAVLEPEYFKEQYVLAEDIPDRRQKDYKQLVAMKSTKDSDGESTGDGSQYVFIKSEIDNLRGMYRSVKRNKTAMAIYMQDGFSELAAFIECPVTGVLMKCKFDRITAETDISLDLKKTQDARKEAFTRSIGNYGYYISAAYYSHIYKLLTGCDLSFKYNAVEEKAPWGSKVYTADAGSILMGEMKFNEALLIYKECLEKNEWPSYEDEDTEISVPNWVVYELDNNESEEIY